MGEHETWRNHLTIAWLPILPILFLLFLGGYFFSFIGVIIFNDIISVRNKEKIYPLISKMHFNQKTNLYKEMFV